jgi:hypothetical protein
MMNFKDYYEQWFGPYIYAGVPRKIEEKEGKI